MTQPAYLTPAEVVKKWNGAVTVGTLANWRAQGRGPAFVKFGTRVRYPVSQLEQWETRHLHAANDNDVHTERVA